MVHTHVLNRDGLGVEGCRIGGSVGKALMAPVLILRMAANATQRYPA